MPAHRTRLAAAAAVLALAAPLDRRRRPPRPASRSSASITHRAASRAATRPVLRQGRGAAVVREPHAVMQRKLRGAGHVERGTTFRHQTEQQPVPRADHGAPCSLGTGLLPGEGRRQRRLPHLVLRQRSASGPSAADPDAVRPRPSPPAAASVRPGSEREARGRGRSRPGRRTRRPRAARRSRVCSNSSPDLAWRNHTRSPIRRCAAPGPVSGVCTSPAPSRPVRCSPGGSQASAACRGRPSPRPPGRRRAPSRPGGTGGVRRGRRRTPPAGGRRTGSGRTGSGPSRPEPAATSVTTGSAAAVSTEPEPPAFQNSSSTSAASASATSRRRTSSWAWEADFMPRTSRDRHLLGRDDVGQPGHLALVGHHADQPEAVPLPDGAGERDHVGRVVERRPLGADVLAADPEPGVDVDRDPDRHRQGAADRVDDVEVGDVVDHQRDRGRGAGGADELGEGAPVDGGVGDHQVVADPVLVQPQRLAQRVGEDAVERVVAQRPAQQLGDPYGLGGDPDRRPRGAAREVVGVGVEGLEVDDHQRRGQRSGGRGRGRAAGAPAGGARWGEQASGDPAPLQDLLDVGEVVVEQRLALLPGGGGQLALAPAGAASRFLPEGRSAHPAAACAARRRCRAAPPTARRR